MRGKQAKTQYVYVEKPVRRGKQRIPQLFLIDMLNVSKYECERNS